MHIYFMGVCGTAMGNVALMLQDQGHTVSGADENVYPPMSDILKTSGITLYEGFDAERLKTLNPDQVVIGNAQSRGNPEIEWLLETRQIPYLSLPELLKNTILKDRQNIVITGTHGKTTTSTLTTYLLSKNNKNPGYLIGGVPKDLPSGASLGKDTDPFVIEGDEYDSAFFDKRSKFVHYMPNILAINNLEFDHGDIFRDLEDIQRTFTHVMRIVPKNGYLIVNGDDINIHSLLPIDWTTTLQVGLGSANDLIISNFQDTPEGSTFNLTFKNTPWATVKSPLRGLFNARNTALAALSAGLSVHPEDPTRLSLDCLSAFQGVKRRQEVLYKNDKCLIIEDFGHHPTAIKNTLQALRESHPEHRIIACFEPRSNTAKSNHFQNEFTEALTHADAAYIGAIKTRLKEKLNTELMATSLTQQGIPSCALTSNKELATTLFEALNGMETPALVCFFTNGSFDGAMSELTEKFSLQYTR